jgi:hypothetical protein
MPEFDFFMTDNERSELISFIIAKGARIIPDKRYPSEKYLSFLSIEDYYDSIAKGECKFFILNDSFSFEPLINSKNRFSTEPFYSIDQRKGGPYIDLIFYLGHSEDAIIPYKRSVLSYYNKFIHYNSSDELKAPDSLKAFYKILTQFVKSKCKSVKKSGKTYWMSEKVKAEI